MTPTAPKLTVADLCVNYGDVRALEQVSLEVYPGSVTALIGVNGSGKSTLLKAIIGLLRPARGTVEIDGAPARAARKAGRIAYMSQGEEVDLAFPFRVRDVVASGLTRRGPGSATSVAEALERVGLTEMSNRQISALSGGQRKRTFIARAIAQDADLMLLDEPFAGVDHSSESVIRDLIAELSAQGKTILLATHDLANLHTLADQAVLLAGRIIAHGTPGDVCTPNVLAQVFGLSASGLETGTGCLSGGKG